MAGTGPPTRSHSQVVKYRRFVTTRANAQDNTNAVRYLREFEGALKGGVFVWLFSSDINKLSPGLQTTPLSHWKTEA